MMRAVRLNVETQHLRVETVPVPHPAHGQVRVKVGAAGLCMSDVHLIRGHGRPQFLSGPEVTLGHEVSGTVDEIGPGVTTCAVGDRVALYAGRAHAGGMATMGVDFDGGWADYVLADAAALVPLPSAISFEEGSILGDAVATPWAAITSTAAVQAGQAVGVWGLGGLGTHAIALLRFIGAAPIFAFDPLPSARARALDLGADVALDPTQDGLIDVVLAGTVGRGLDMALDFAGFSGSVNQARRCITRGGKVVVVGISGEPLEIHDSLQFVYGMHQLLGHYGVDRTHLEDIVRLVDLGRLGFASSVTGTYRLEDAAQAVADLEAKKNNPVRLVLLP